MSEPAAATPGGPPPRESTSGAGSSTETAQVVDGIPLDALRSLAGDARNLSNLFYAQLLSAKTSSKSDALLLARVYLQHGQAAACWRTLEEAQLLAPLPPPPSSSAPQGRPAALSSSPSLFWSTLEVAVTALAATEDWTLLQQLVQDLVQDCTTAAHLAAPDSSLFGVVTPVAASRPDDAPSEAALVEALLPPPAAPEDAASSPNTVDDRSLASRVWYWRAKAHWELGDPLLATEYWSTALRWDPRNQAAWNALVALQLLTPQQALDLVRSLRGVEDWLQSLYVAQIPATRSPPPPVEATETPAAAAQGFQAPSRGSFGMVPLDGEDDMEEYFGDASSIQLVSPPFRLPHLTPAASTPTFSRGVPATPAPPPRPSKPCPDDAEPNEATTATPASCHEEVQEAFNRLTLTYKLGHSPHVLALAARRAYNCYDWKNCLVVCEQLAAMGSIVPSSSPASTLSTLASSSTFSSSSASEAAYCYIAVLVLLGRHRSLFQLAHEWVSAAPKSPQSWFAVGAYYYATGRYHVAQRHFCRATRLDPQCSPAWMAFGCSFAMVDESDQALASFRAAQRLAPGDALPLLYMGVEYVRTNHLTLAQHFLHAARVQSQDDPLCLHELGVLELHKGRLDSAVQWFTRALAALYPRRDGGAAPFSLDAVLAECSDPYWEPTVFNLGHAHRRARRFELAQLCFERCLALSRSSSAYAALAFTVHLRGKVDAAISLYHQALAGKPDDPFASEMLNRALRESLQRGLDDDWIPPVPPTPEAAELGATTLSLRLKLDEEVPASPSMAGNETMDQTGSDMDMDVDMSG